jgi:hypothetical protein
MAEKLKELTQAVDSHVKYSVGTSNKFIENFALRLCPPYFVGVFAANRIPRRELAERERFITIVNLGEKKTKGEQRGQSPVGHFVVVCVEKREDTVLGSICFTLFTTQSVGFYTPVRTSTHRDKQAADTRF